jgi:hypothetical protein
VLNIEIEGQHEEADGFLLHETMQTTFEGVLLRKLRHGIHVWRRARNVLISHCHIYDNSGIGVYFDHANLHQVIIASSHISYNRLSGIKIENGGVRNVQITGNDIEYNYDTDAGEAAPPAAEIWIETSAEGASIREGTIASNTIQSRYSPGGANIMIIGRDAEQNHKAGMLAISGNLIGSQETNVRLVACRAITLSGNVIYSGHRRNLHASDCRNLVVSGNSFDHNPDYGPNELATGVTFERCMACSFTGNVLQDAEAGRHTASSPVEIEREGLLEVIGCNVFTLGACQIVDSAQSGLYVQGSSHVLVSGCTVLDTRGEPMMTEAVRWTGSGRANAMHGNVLGPGTRGTTAVDETADVQNHDAQREEAT